MPNTKQIESQRNKTDRRHRLLANYKPLQGVHDELITPDGQIRPQWEALLDEWTICCPASAHGR
jgi:hypothetical protein